MDDVGNKIDHSEALREVLTSPETIRAVWRTAASDKDLMQVFVKAAMSVVKEELSKEIGSRIITLAGAALLALLISLIVKYK